MSVRDQWYIRTNGDLYYKGLYHEPFRELCLGGFKYVSIVVIIYVQSITLTTTESIVSFVIL